jgi:hypothetical protein
MTMARPPEGLQLDLLTVCQRLRQIQEEREDGLWLLWDRILTCDLPRLESHLTPETVEWWLDQEYSH